MTFAAVAESVHEQRHEQFAGQPDLLVMSHHRSFYRGKLPGANRRSLGGYNVYVALDSPFRFRSAQGAWQNAELAVAAPYEEHSVCSGASNLIQVLIGEEDVTPTGLPQWMQGPTRVIDHPMRARELQKAGSAVQSCIGSDFEASLDNLLFGRSLSSRKLDSRVAQVVASIAREPGGRHSAGDCASSVNLSPSRFLHLFKDEVGTPFRRYRAWKRAHGLLKNLEDGGSLTEIALDSGYSDSSHLSHSIRSVFGNCPREIMASLEQMTQSTQAGWRTSTRVQAGVQLNRAAMPLRTEMSFMSQGPSSAIFHNALC